MTAQQPPATTHDLASLAAECRELLELAEKATELWPCPFCGSPAHVIYDGPTWMKVSWVVDDGWYRAQCTKCGASVGEFRKKREVLPAWNTRTAAPSIAEKCLGVIAEITEMRAEIAERTRDHEALWAKFREREADRAALLTVARAAKEMKEAGIATSRSMDAIGQIWDALAALPPHLLAEINGDSNG